MKPLINKLLVGFATLAIASTPLVASAQDWHHNDRGYEHNQRDVHYRGDVHRTYHRAYNEGYYGVAPAGFHGYYHNGGWYHHRRQQAGIFIYF
jgi:hypothetical protein